MKNHIKKVINDWDPMELLSFAPQDEYKNEINQIYNFLSVNKNASEKELGNIIFKIFINAFDKNIFKFTLNDCLKISKKILTKKEL